MKYCHLLYIVLLFNLSGCSQRDQLDDLYFPTKNQVYVYSANDSLGVEYWEVQWLSDDLMKTTIFNGSFDITQISFESIYQNGVNLDSLIIYQEGQPINATVESGFIFPFEVIDSSEVLLYRILWQTKDENAEEVTYEIIRNRRFTGFTEKTILGEKRKCAVVRLDERIISNSEGSLEIETSGEEWYAEGTGLVYRQRTVNPQMKLEQKLLDVLTPEEFNQRR